MSPGTRTHGCRGCPETLANRRNAIEHRCIKDSKYRLACTHEKFSCTFRCFHEKQMRRHWKKAHKKEHVTKSESWYSIETKAEFNARVARVIRLDGSNQPTPQNHIRVGDVLESRGSGGVTLDYCQSINELLNGEEGGVITSTLEEGGDNDFDDIEYKLDRRELNSTIGCEYHHGGGSHVTEVTWSTEENWARNANYAVEMLHANTSSSRGRYYASTHNHFYATRSAPSGAPTYTQRYPIEHGAFGSPSTSTPSEYTAQDAQHLQDYAHISDGSSVPADPFTGHLAGESTFSVSSPTLGEYHGMSLQQQANQYSDVTTGECYNAIQASSVSSSAPAHYPTPSMPREELCDNDIWLRLAGASLKATMALAPAHSPNARRT